MTTPEELEREHTLLTAVARFNVLRGRATMAATAEEMADGEPSVVPPLTSAEALELLALGEAIVRKAGYGRQLDVRAARRAGASWTRIGAALGTTKQSAWELHQRWIDVQAARGERVDHTGLSPQDAAEARRLAGLPEE